MNLPKNYPRIAYSLIALSLATLPASGVDRSWKGLGGDNLWSNSLNWSALPSTAGGDGLIFEGTTQTAAYNNFSGATFNKITFSAGAGAFVLSGSSINLGGAVTNNSTSLQTIGLDLVLTGARSFNTAAGDLAVSGNVSGAFGVTKSSAGTLTLSGSNSFSGTLLVENVVGNRLRLAGTHAAGTGALDVQIVSGGLVFASSVGTFEIGALGGILGNSKSIATIDLVDESNQAVTLKLTGSKIASHDGALVGAGSLVVELGEGGHQRLTKANTYTGGTILNSGTLGLYGSAGNIASSGALTVNGGVLEIHRNSLAKTVAVSSLNGTGGEISANMVTATATLRVDSSGDDRFDGKFSETTGKFALTKRGAGTLTLGGSSNYTGATTVEVGHLNIDGAINGSNVTVQSGAALGGHGGKITGGTVTLNSGSAFAFALSDPSVVGLTVDSITLGSNIGLELSLTSALLSNSDFTLIEGYAGGTFAKINGAAFGVGNTFQLEFGGIDYDFQLVYGPTAVHALALNVIPEPGTYALMLGGVGLLAGVALRRKRY